METKIVMETYPVQMKTFTKTAVSLNSIEKLIEYFISKIDADPMASHIATFDHYAHTKDNNGEISPDILGAQNIIFCFGPKLIQPVAVGLRPRSIGIVDLGDKLQVNFMSPPAAPIREKMTTWVEEIL